MSKSCRGSLLLLFICICVLAQSQGSPTIHNGAKVYVEKMDGFGDYFIAAMHSKQVPLTVVTDKAKADYIVDGSAETNRAHVRATIKMVTNDDESPSPAPSTTITPCTANKVPPRTARRS